MLRHFVVPVDGSRASFDALPVAIRFAKEVDGQVTVIGVYDVDDVSLVRHAVEDEIARLGKPVESCRFVLTNEHPADVIVDIVSSTPHALVVMSSQGRGRSAAVLGSTTDKVLRCDQGPPRRSRAQLRHRTVGSAGRSVRRTAGRIGAFRTDPAGRGRLVVAARWHPLVGAVRARFVGVDLPSAVPESTRSRDAASDRRDRSVRGSGRRTCGATDRRVRPADARPSHPHVHARSHRAGSAAIGLGGSRGAPQGAMSGRLGTPAGPRIRTRCARGISPNPQWRRRSARATRT